MIEFGLKRQSVRDALREKGIQWIDDQSNDDPTICHRNNLRPLTDLLLDMAPTGIQRSLDLLQEQDAVQQEMLDLLIGEMIVGAITDVPHGMKNIPKVELHVDWRWKRLSHAMQLSVMRELVRRVKGNLNNITREDLESWVDLANHKEGEQRRKGLRVFTGKTKANWHHCDICQDFELIPAEPFVQGNKTFRPWRDGDRMRNRRVAQILKDMDIPEPLRKGWPVWESDGEVVGVFYWHKNTQDVPPEKVPHEANPRCELL